MFMGSLQVVDLANNRIVSSHEEEHYIRAVTALPGRNQVIYGTNGGRVRVFDLESGRVAMKLPGHTAPVYTIAVSGDGRVAVSAAQDHTLRVWDLARAVELTSFRGEWNMRSAAISEDCRTIVAGDWLGRLHFLVIERELAGGPAFH